MNGCPYFRLSHFVDCYQFLNILLKKAVSLQSYCENGLRSW